jgi:hypothetical protein
MGDQPVARPQPTQRTEDKSYPCLECDPNPRSEAFQGAKNVEISGASKLRTITDGSVSSCVIVRGCPRTPTGFAGQQF